MGHSEDFWAASYIKKTGDEVGRWSEYEEKTKGNGVGHFWMRDDGLRMGYRPAGKYYKEGTTPEKVGAPIHAKDIPGCAHLATGQQYFANARAFDVVGDLRESAKLERLEDHIRIVFQDKEIERIVSIDGRPVKSLLDNLKLILETIDKKYPGNYQPTPKKKAPAAKR